MPAGINRTAFAQEAGTTVVAIGGAPAGKPYEPSGWELFAPLMPLFDSGDYDEGADRAQALLVGDPPYSGLYYNTACFESRAGRIEAGLAHLRRAVELSPSLAESPAKMRIWRRCASRPDSPRSSPADPVSLDKCPVLTVRAHEPRATGRIPEYGG